MLKHLRKIWLAGLLVVLLPCYAFADVGAGIIFMGAALVFALLFIVLLEAVVYQRLLQVKDALIVSFAANLITTMAGVFGLRLVNYFSLYPLLLLSFFLTVILETPICFVFFPQIGKKKVIAAVIWANVLSYIAIVLMCHLMYVFSYGWALFADIFGVMIVLAIYIYQRKLEGHSA